MEIILSKVRGSGQALWLEAKNQDFTKMRILRFTGFQGVVKSPAHFTNAIKLIEKILSG